MEKLAKICRISFFLMVNGHVGLTFARTKLLKLVCSALFKRSSELGRGVIYNWSLMLEETMK